MKNACLEIKKEKTQQIIKHKIKMVGKMKEVGGKVTTVCSLIEVFMAKVIKMTSMKDKLRECVM